MTCKKFFCKKVYGTVHTFEVERDSLLTITTTKKQKYFLLPDHQVGKNLIPVFGFYERTKKDKSEFVAKFARTLVTIIFI